MRQRKARKAEFELSRSMHVAAALVLLADFSVLLALFQWQALTSTLFLLFLVPPLVVFGILLGGARRQFTSESLIESAMMPSLMEKSRFIENHWDAVIFTNLQGTICFSNPMAESLFGYSRNSLDGLPIKGLFGGVGHLVDLIFDELRSSAFWQGETAINDAEGVSVRLGVWVLRLTNDHGQPCGISWSFRDITALKNQERALRLSEKRFKSMAVNAPGIIFEWRCGRDGSDLGFNYISPRIEGLFGLSAECCQQDTRELLQHLAAEDYTPFIKSIQRVTEKLRSWNHVFRMDLPERGVRWVRGVATPIDCDEHEVIFHGILMDITREVEFQNELILAKEKAEIALSG